MLSIVLRALNREDLNESISDTEIFDSFFMYGGKAPPRPDEQLVLVSLQMLCDCARVAKPSICLYTSVKPATQPCITESRMFYNVR